MSTRVMIVATSVVLAGAAAAAFGMVRVPNPSVYLLFAAGVVALVMLRRRTS